MTNYEFFGYDDDGKPLFTKHEAVDHIHVEHIDAYVEDAKKRWRSVVVGEETDHGPGGEHGAYSLRHLGIGK